MRELVSSLLIISIIITPATTAYSQSVSSGARAGIVTRSQPVHKEPVVSGQNNKNQTNGYQWSTSTNNVRDVKLASPIGYTTSKTFDNPPIVYTESNSDDQKSSFQKMQNAMESEDQSIEDIINNAMICIFGGSEDLSNDEKFACILAVEYAYANELLTQSMENKVSNVITSNFITDEDKVVDVRTAWAAILMGILSNYYPEEEKAESPIPLYQNKEANKTAYVTAVKETYPAWRSKNYRKYLTKLFSSCVTSYDCPIQTKQGISMAWGYMDGEDTANNIISAINTLNIRVMNEEVKKDDSINQFIADLLEFSTIPSNNIGLIFGPLAGLVASTDEDLNQSLYKPFPRFLETENSVTAYNLFNALGYLATVQNNYIAKRALLSYMQYSGINDNYACIPDQYSFTLGIYAAFAAHYYGMREALPYIESLAKWQEENGWGAYIIVPLNISEQAYNLIPEYVREAKKITKPEYTTGELVHYNIYYIAKEVRNALGFVLLWELAASSVMAALFGSTAAASSSFLAADVGYLIAGRYGTVASYEFTLMLEQRLVSQAFSQTIAGKITDNVLIRPINYISKRFGGSINKLKSLIHKGKIKPNTKLNYTTAGMTEKAIFSTNSRGGMNPFPTSNFETVVPSHYTAGTKTSNTLFVQTSNTVSKLPANTYVMTAQDFAKASQVSVPVSSESVAVAVESVAPINSSSYINILKPASASSSNIPTVTILSSNNVLTTISPAAIGIGSVQTINGIQILSTINNSGEVININRVIYQDHVQIKQFVTAEFPDGATLPIEPDEFNDLNELLNNYRKYCPEIAA